jgi:hypothetical protein
MTLSERNTRRAEMYMRLMSPGLYYSSREVYEMACRQVSYNFQPKNTNAVSGVLGWAARHGQLSRIGTPGRYRSGLVEVNA